jgi:hypothetical protein
MYSLNLDLCHWEKQYRTLCEILIMLAWQRFRQRYSPHQRYYEVNISLGLSSHRSFYCSHSFSSAAIETTDYQLQVLQITNILGRINSGIPTMKLEGFADPVRKDSGRGSSSNLDPAQDPSTRDGPTTATTNNNNGSSNGSTAFVSTFMLRLFVVDLDLYKC